MLEYDRRLKERSQQLRKEMTPAEKYLWSKIRKKQVKRAWFYRQKTIGEYIADFYCPSSKLVIEVDGGHHFSDEILEYDELRNQYMEGLGLTVLRFTNEEILKNIKSVLETTKNKME
jgi:very-short-patch-repair endonuclease